MDRWIREHCPEIKELQGQGIESQITSNVGGVRGGGWPLQNRIATRPTEALGLEP